MDAMKRLAGIGPAGVFGSLGDDTFSSLAAKAEQLAAQAAVAQQQQQPSKGDSLYPHISEQVHSTMTRNQLYNPFMAASNSSHPLHPQTDSMFEQLNQQSFGSMMAGHPSMSQLTSMGTMANFADHMSQMMYHSHPSAYSSTTGQQQVYGTPALSNLSQWANNSSACQQPVSMSLGQSPFVLANPRATFPGPGTSTADGSSSGQQHPQSGATSSGHGRSHAASSQHQHSTSSHHHATHHHQTGANTQAGPASAAAAGLGLSGLSSASLAGLPSQIGMPPGVSAATPDCDPRELEAFAERFKQRRIKLGVTQADVGVALGKLQIPGVGPLSQSTICRFESLTLSHNNMIALKPILEAWLDRAEKEMRERKENASDVSASGKKRKRTSIPAPEKRSLEAYFQLQPRPSGEKIAQIADKLDLKKNVVRVWFCNQRQKQKRMKFASPGGGPTGSALSGASSSASSSRSSHT